MGYICQYDKVICAALGPKASYVIRHEGGLFWCGIPSRLGKLLANRCGSIEFVSLGFNETFFVRYSDGKWFWNVHSDELEEILLTRNDIFKLYLCPDNDNVYCIHYENSPKGTFEWRGDLGNAFDNLARTRRYMNPTEIQYTKDIISEAFASGDSIQATANMLSSGFPVENIPAIRVVQHNTNFFSLDNRRLWAFKESGIQSVPVSFVKLTDKIATKLSNIVARSEPRITRVRW